jgi:DNA-directed RNA polymerase subunit RPC12/RpoP
MSRRKEGPVTLPIQPVPHGLRAPRARCPQCGDRHAAPIGHWTQRLVYRCPHCSVMFKRTREVPFRF